MNKNLLNISGKISEPIIKVYELIKEVANQNNVKFFVIGATARDMVFDYGYGISVSRATRDIDLAVQVATWTEFQSLKNALIATGQFVSSQMMQRVYYQNEIPIDIVPFGAIENESNISWPPDGSVKMNVAGFNDAFYATQTVRLRESPILEIPVVTPAALVILKLMAWQDRASEQRKDAIDLAFILRWYLDTGHTERLTEQHNDLLDDDFDFELTGARLLGRDIAGIVSVQTKQKLHEILSIETGEQKQYRLIEAMTNRQNGQTFEKNLALLQHLYLGFNETKDNKLQN
ncbi:MAG: nucleotidyl transferase AbiEii/AbiGii toxin family protein [Methylobacter sp.]|nr:nucleotidyl transferase AbiEii/AbiGii toxin family protein [Methylobacter sp.]